MKKIIPLFILLLLSCSAFCQDISGFWQGVLYQPNGQVGYYRFSMDLSQSQIDNSISGKSRIEIVDNPSFGVMSLIGTFDTLNNRFSFQETVIDTQLIVNFPGWCIKSGNLIYDSLIEKLEGPWTGTFIGGTCEPGNIELWRLRIISDTIFCENEPIELEVTGQDVKWYSDIQLTNLIWTGNVFTPNITSTTTFYITQTHYNTQSPAIAIHVKIIPCNPNSFISQYNKVEIKISPNPTEDLMNYTFEGMQSDNIKFEIYSPMGKMVLSGELTKSRGTINVSVLPKGLYFFVAKYDKGKSISQFLKM